MDHMIWSKIYCHLVLLQFDEYWFITSTTYLILCWLGMNPNLTWLLLATRVALILSGWISPSIVASVVWPLYKFLFYGSPHSFIQSQTRNLWKNFAHPNKILVVIKLWFCVIKLQGCCEIILKVIIYLMFTSFATETFLFVTWFPVFNWAKGSMAHH